MSESKGVKIYAAIAAVIADVGTVGKNTRNKEQGYVYRSADAICEELHQALGKHKVFCTCQIHSRDVTEKTARSGSILTCVSLKCTYIFWGEDGSSVSTDSWGESMDSGDKATNKAMTAAYKYALIQTFCLMGAGDADADSPEPVEADKAAKWVRPASNPKESKQVPQPVEPVAEMTREESAWVGVTQMQVIDATTSAALLDICKEISNKSEPIKQALRKLCSTRMDVLKHEEANASSQPEAARA
jgi:hypothetical protein